MVKPPFSSFRVITANFSCVRIFRIFTVIIAKLKFLFADRTTAGVAVTLRPTGAGGKGQIVDHKLTWSLIYYGPHRARDFLHAEPGYFLVILHNSCSSS